MNTRHNPGRSTQKEQCSRRISTGDQRHLVLICIGLLLIAASVAGRTIPKKSAATTAGTLIWLAGSTIKDGVYRIDTQQMLSDVDTSSILYPAFGMIPPVNANSGMDFGRQKDQLPGLLLENGQPPVAISPPAVFYSFMFQPIPINEADRELLTTVPGIGPRLAEEILVLREKKDHFSSPAELLDVPGIGPVKLKRFAKHFSFKQSGT